MLLGAHETVVRSAYAVLEASASDAPRRRPGVLYLTTERLVFESPGSRGVVRDYVGGRDPEILVDEPLSHLRNVSVRRGRVVKPRLVVDRAEHRVVFDVLDPDGWAVAIADGRHRAELARERSLWSAGAAGPTVVKVRCRFCGGLAEETSNRCPSCGAPL